MSFSSDYTSDEFWVGGVLARRVLGWLVDLVIIALLMAVLWWLLFWFGVLTLGLGFGAMALLPFVPFCYHFVWLLSSVSATPGQQLCGLTVRRNDDLGPPTGLQVLVSTASFYLTMATCGLLLVVAVFTTRKRTLHDLFSGLVVVRVRAMTALTRMPSSWHVEPFVS